jgi:hypothetical protein
VADLKARHPYAGHRRLGPVEHGGNVPGWPHPLLCRGEKDLEVLEKPSAISDQLLFSFFHFNRSSNYILSSLSEYFLSSLEGSC